MKLNKSKYYIFPLVFLISLLLLLASFLSDSLALRLNFGFSLKIRVALGFLSHLFYPSLFELLIVASPFFLVFLIFYVVRAKTPRAVRFRFLKSLSTILLFPTLYILTLGIAYLSPFLSDRISEKIDKSDLAMAARHLSDAVSAEEENLNKPLDIAELRAEFITAYSTILDLDVRGRVTLPRPKPAFFSSFMSKCGIYGDYSYLTGEVIVNSQMPKYLLPFVIAHEYAHAIGFLGEADAELLAYLACINSEDPNIRYSGALSALEILLSELACVDTAEYRGIYSELSDGVRADLDLHRQFVLKSADDPFLRATGALNSVHAGVWDQEGGYREAARLITLAVNNPYHLTRIGCSISTVSWSERWVDFLYAAECHLPEKYKWTALKTRLYR